MDKRLKWLLVGLPIGIACFAVLIGPLSWSASFIWDWLVHDDIIAMSNFEMAVRSGMGAKEAFTAGLLWGCCVDLIIGIGAWLDR